MIPPGTLDSSDTRPTAAISYRILQPPSWLKKQFLYIFFQKLYFRKQQVKIFQTGKFHTFF